MLGDLLDFLVVVVCDERLVAIEFLQRLNRLDRIGINNPIPDEILPFLGGQFLDQFVDCVKLLHACHIKTAAEVVESFHNLRVAVDFNGIVNLHAGKVLVKKRVIFAQFAVVDNKQRGAMCLGKLQECFLIHRRGRVKNWNQSPSVSRKFLNCHGSVVSSWG